MMKNAMSREFIAIIGLDEGKIMECIGNDDITPGEFLESEFGIMLQSGITLENWALVDFDVQWEQYLRYLVDWAIFHSSDDAIGKSPMSYKLWLKNQ